MALHIDAADGIWKHADQWNQLTYPDGADDDATINSHAIELAAPVGDAACGDLIVEAGGSLELTGVAGIFEVVALVLDGGTFIDGGWEVQVGGDVLLTAGTFTHTGKITMVADGDVSSGATPWSFAPTEFEILVGVTATPIAAFWAKKFSGAGDIGVSVQTVVAYGHGHDFYMLTGTCGSHLNFQQQSSYTNAGPVTLATGKNLTISLPNQAMGVTTLSQAAINCDATFTISRARDAQPKFLTVTMTGPITGGCHIILGQGAGKHGALVCGPFHHVIGDLDRGTGDQSDNALTLDADTELESSGTIDGTGFVVVSTGGRVVKGSVVGLAQGGGSLTGRLITWGCPTDANSIAAGAEHTARELGMMTLAA